MTTIGWSSWVFALWMDHVPPCSSAKPASLILPARFLEVFAFLTPDHLFPEFSFLSLISQKKKKVPPVSSLRLGSVPLLHPLLLLMGHTLVSFHLNLCLGFVTALPAAASLYCSILFSRHNVLKCESILSTSTHLQTLQSEPG